MTTERNISVGGRFLLGTANPARQVAVGPRVSPLSTVTTRWRPPPRKGWPGSFAEFLPSSQPATRQRRCSGHWVPGLWGNSSPQQGPVLGASDRAACEPGPGRIRRRPFFLHLFTPQPPPGRGLCPSPTEPPLSLSQECRLWRLV